MRLIRLKIHRDVAKALRQVSEQQRTGDEGFVEDAYALLRLKGQGLPSQGRADAIIKYLGKKDLVGPANAAIIVRKRVQALKELSSTAYFQGLTSLPDPIDATRRLMTNMRKLYLKYREAQCVTCQYLTACDFGAQYKHAATDVRRVIDPDFQQKVNPQCPVLPEIDRVQQMAAAAAEHKKLAQQRAEQKITGTALDPDAEDKAKDAAETQDVDTDVSVLDPETSKNYPDFDTSSDGSGMHGITITGSHTGSEYVLAFEMMVNGLSRSQLVIFELGQMFATSLLAEKKGVFLPTVPLAKDVHQTKMETASDESRLIASAYALPDDVYDEKVGKKQLTKRQNVEPKKKKQGLYLLIDESGSMAQPVNGKRYGLLTRGALAAVFALAILRRVRDDGGIAYVRFFAGRPTARQSARTIDEFEDLLMHVATTDFNGGSTRMVRAIDTVCTDIRTAVSTEEISQCEVLIIGDMEDYFTLDEAKAAAQGQPINILDVAMQGYQAGSMLHQFAARYFGVDPAALDISQMVKLVGPPATVAMP